MQGYVHRRSNGNHGIAYVMVMLYLMLFSVLAVGFCAASNMSMQIARNDRSVAESLAAADSGMQFARLHLGKVSISADVLDADLPGVLAEQLGRQLDGSPNMQGQIVKRTGQIMFLPSENSFVSLDSSSGTRFQIQLAVTGRDLWVKTIGRGNNAEIARAIQLRFRLSPRSPNETDLRFIPVGSTYEEVSP
jgi:hypothetical protein